MSSPITVAFFLLAALANGSDNELKKGQGLKSLMSSTRVVLSAEVDSDILADYNALEKWESVKGKTDRFIKENGPKRALAWKTAAEEGSPKGMILYARYLQEGPLSDIDVIAAVKWLKKAVELGDVVAMADMGVCYELGSGIGRDEIEAAKWYRKAAEHGNTKGMYGLGRCYINGAGLAKDDAEAVKWYRKSAELAFDVQSWVLLPGRSRRCQGHRRGHEVAPESFGNR
jgi:TPR repeat protein